MSDETPHEPLASKPASVPWQSMQVGQTLVQRKLITPEQLAQALAHQRTRDPERPLADVLVELGMVPRLQVTAALAGAAGVPFTVVLPSMVHADALSSLPPEFCEQNNVLPLASADGWLTVAVEDFTNVHLVEQIKRLTNQRLQIVAASGESLRSIRAKLFKDLSIGPAAGTGGAGLDQSELEELTVLSSQHKAEEEPAGDLEAAAAGSPVIRLVNQIIKAAVSARASDIHIEPDEQLIRIRYRVDGDLVSEPLRPAISLLPAVISRIKIMAGMDISERRLPQDGGVTVMLANRPIELRVSTMATTGGEKVVMRLVDNSAGIRKLEDLGFLPDLLKEFRRGIREPNGIILVTGPTGSGKSTTLYSALAEIANEKLNLSSIEDPVEYHLKGVSQFQVNVKAGFTFARALRSLLRQDPDVIMVGEIRDAETAKLATEAALTGHLVLATLHTNDAPSAVPRLVNMGVEPYLVAASVRAVLAQRLVRRLCPHCRQAVPVGSALQRLLAERCGGAAPITSAYRGEGCERCRYSGFAGRTSLHELLVTDEEMLGALGHDMSLPKLRQAAATKGFTPLLHDCLAKLHSGLIGLESLLDVVGGAELVDGAGWVSGANPVGTDAPTTPVAA